MALLIFPPNPVNGQLYPVNPSVGQAQYQWDSASQTWVLLGKATGVAAGTYGDAYNVGQFTVDATGRVTFAQNVAIASGGIGTVTSITAGVGLTGGTITTSGTIALDTTYMNSTYLTLSGGTMTGDIIFAPTQTIDSGIVV